MARTVGTRLWNHIRTSPAKHHHFTRTRLTRNSAARSGRSLLTLSYLQTIFVDGASLREQSGRPARLWHVRTEMRGIIIARHSFALNFAVWCTNRGLIGKQQHQSHSARDATIDADACRKQQSESDNNKKHEQKKQRDPVNGRRG